MQSEPWHHPCPLFPLLATLFRWMTFGNSSLGWRKPGALWGAQQGGYSLAFPASTERSQKVAYRWGRCTKYVAPGQTVSTRRPPFCWSAGCWRAAAALLFGRWSGGSYLPPLWPKSGCIQTVWSTRRPASPKKCSWLWRRRCVTAASPVWWGRSRGGSASPPRDGCNSPPKLRGWALSWCGAVGAMTTPPLVSLRPR